MPDFNALAQQFNLLEVSTLVLMGSYGRGDPGPFSDVDLVRFTREEVAELPGNGSHLIEDRLVVVSQVTPTQVEKGFSQPEVAVEVIAGLRSGKPLIDKDGSFAAIQQRAREFQWDDAMQTKANAWASRQMVGWIEEVHKGLEGLRRGDPGRLLHARFGCSWGLARVMCVQHGVLLTGDNTLVAQVTEAIGSESDWSRLCRQAFGLDGKVSLEDCVRAGLQLYVETAVLLQNILRPQDTPLIQATVERIKINLP
jgi:hypothetical protein